MVPAVLRGQSSRNVLSVISHVGLALKQHSDVLDLALSSQFRWVMSGFGGALLAITLFTTTEGTSALSTRNALPLVVSALLLIGATFHERWRWNTPNQRIEHRFGIGPIARTKLFPFSSVRMLRIAGVLISQPGDSSLKPGSRKLLLDMRRSAVHLSMIDTKSRVFRLDVVKGSNAHDLLTTARSIAQFTDLPLKDEVRYQGPW